MFPHVHFLCTWISFLFHSYVFSLPCATAPLSFCHDSSANSHSHNVGLYTSVSLQQSQGAPVCEAHFACGISKIGCSVSKVLNQLTVVALVSSRSSDTKVSVHVLHTWLVMVPMILGHFHMCHGMVPIDVVFSHDMMGLHFQHPLMKPPVGGIWNFRNNGIIQLADNHCFAKKIILSWLRDCNGCTFTHCDVNAHVRSKTEIASKEYCCSQAISQNGGTGMAQLIIFHPVTNFGGSAHFIQWWIIHSGLEHSESSCTVEKTIVMDFWHNRFTNCAVQYYVALTALEMCDQTQVLPTQMKIHLCWTAASQWQWSTTNDMGKGHHNDDQGHWKITVGWVGIRLKMNRGNKAGSLVEKMKNQKWHLPRTVMGRNKLRMTQCKITPSSRCKRPAREEMTWLMPSEQVM